MKYTCKNTLCHHYNPNSSLNDKLCTNCVNRIEKAERASDSKKSRKLKLKKFMLYLFAICLLIVSIVCVIFVLNKDNDKKTGFLENNRIEKTIYTF